MRISLSSLANTGGSVPPTGPFILRLSVMIVILTERVSKPSSKYAKGKLKKCHRVRGFLCAAMMRLVANEDWGLSEVAL